MLQNPNGPNSNDSRVKRYRTNMGGENWTYGNYLQLDELLKLQGEDRGICSDEMHFIIVHQTFELWFKQIIRELSEVRNILSQEQVPEKDIPQAVERLGRTTEIFKLMAAQWSVMETLTPQGFLSFRDGLGSASGFESFQMRKFEILLGLKNEDRLFGMDPIDTFRKLAENSEKDAAILQDLEDALAKPSLEESLMKWISRTPIMGSIYDSEKDSESVEDYVNKHLLAHKSMGEDAAKRMSSYGTSDLDKAVERFNSAHQSAISFLVPEGKINRARASLLFIESYRELPLLAWPRKLIDAIVELEESMVKWRHSHARMVERIMGRRIGTGGTSGVDYLDKTSQYRVFKDLWAVRTILVKSDKRPELINPDFYGFYSEKDV
mgnify:FL=1